MALKNVYSINVDIKRRMTSVVPTFKQGDAATLKFRVYDDGVLLELTNDTYSEITFRLPNGETFLGYPELINGELVYNFTGLEMVRPGKIILILSIKRNNTMVSVQPFNCFIIDSMRGDTLADIGILQELVTRTNELNTLIEKLETFEYSPTTTYDFPNLVTYNGSTYIVLKEVTGITPNNDKVNYRLAAQGGNIVNFLEEGSIKREHINFYKPLSGNLFDSDSTDIDFLGYYALNGNYTLPSSWDVGFGSTGFIKIKSNTTYYTNISGFFTFWDENHNLLSGLHFEVPSTFTTPSGCFYVNSAIWLEDIDTLMIVEGTEPQDVIIEGKYTDEKLLLNKDQVKSGLFGLKWNVLGDSISTNDYSTTAYYQIIASKHNMVVNSYGISSTTIAVSSRSNPMCERYVNMNNDADIITVFGGINDYGVDVPLGTINDSSKTTFMGALNVLCSGLIAKYPAKRIAFITPMQYRDADQTKLLTYLNAIKSVCGKYSIPVLDLFSEGGLYPGDDYINTTYFTNADGLHPNASGHEIIARRIEAFIKTLCI